ncbi:hypothetical protein, partial [Polaromonas sp.]|uniref:hypothetical protein n=1 Tax=Polaromonas sp. TaxID=1869339 RepID=UPI0035663FA2
MAIDKSLYTAPQGMPMEEMGAPIEIEIEDPESVSISMGELSVVLSPDGEDTADTFAANLAEFMDERDLSSLGTDLIDEFDKDNMDRKDWIRTYVEGLKLLGLKYEERTDPWSGACGVFHPMLTESVVRFQSEGIMETFPAAGPVKTQILGKDTPKKEEAATRVREDMNYQLTEVMVEYRPEHEKLLWSLPIAGSAFKKVYYDPAKGRQVAVFIPAEDIVVPYGASNLESAERVTHVMRKTQNEVLKLQEAGFYADIDLGEPSMELDDIEKQKAEEMGMSAIQDDRFRILEMHVDIDLAGFEHKNKKGVKTGIALPYVVTLEKGSRKVLAIRRNWYEEDELNTKRQHFVHYQYIPGFGFYGYGLIHLIGGYAKSATMIIRQLVDAGTLSNLPGGLKSRGLRIKGDDTPIQPGEFRDVDVPSGSIRDNILPLPYKEPSQVLFALFQNIVQEGKQFASAGDMSVSDMSAQAPVGTTLAILERMLKVMGAVQARMHYSMRQEFKLLKVIIADYTPEEYDYEPEEGGRKAKKSDYDMVEVIPVSDPNAATMAQKIVQYQAALQLAQTAPQLYDLPLLHRQMIEVLGIKNAAKLVPIEEDQTPVDPVQENQNLLTSKPVKAFIQQDHQAHISVHMSASQNPKILALMQNNPQAPAIMAALMAHVNEHIGYEYRKQIEQQLGLILPTEEETKNMAPDVAAHVAQLASQASQRLLQQSQAQAAQQQAQKNQQDPMIQMQLEELEIKKGELQLKKQKQLADAAAKADQIRVEEARIDAQIEIAALQVGATA